MSLKWLHVLRMTAFIVYYVKRSAFFCKALRELLRRTHIIIIIKAKPASQLSNLKPTDLLCTPVITI